MSDNWHYPRTELAKQYAMRLQDTLFSRIATYYCFWLNLELIS